MAGFAGAPACVKTPGATSVNDPFFFLRQFEWPNLVSQRSKNESSHILARGYADAISYSIFPSQKIKAPAKDHNGKPDYGNGEPKKTHK